jgi:hypothetical protein
VPLSLSSWRSLVPPLPRPTGSTVAVRSSSTGTLSRLDLVVTGLWAAYWGFASVMVALTYFERGWPRDWDALEAAIAMLLIPPVVLLAIGSGLVWAFAGLSDK